MHRAPHRIAALTLLVVVGMLLSGPAWCEEKKVYEVKVEWYDPNGRWDIPLLCFELMRRDPQLLCTRYSMMQAAGLGGESGKVMAFATGAGPDVFNMYTYQIASYVDQGFLLPLNEFIGEDTNGNGRIDDAEAVWEPWKKLSPLQRKIVTHEGKVYCIPARSKGYVAMMYRRDLFKEHGVSEEPPADWDDLYYRMQKLTWPHMKIRGAKYIGGRRAFYIHRHHVYLYSWVWASGANMVMEGKTNPRTGREHWWPKEETEFRDPETDEDLSREPSRWKADFTSEAMVKAFDYVWKMLHHPWIRDPLTGEPINLTEADVAAGSVRRPGSGELITFDAKADVIRGVAHTYMSDDRSAGYEKYRAFERGEVAMSPGWPGGEYFGASITVRPDQVGYWATPPRVAGDPPRLTYSCHWIGLAPTMKGERHRVKRQKAWTIARHLGTELGQKMYVHYAVQQGLAMFSTPEALKLAGLDEYIEEIPDHWKRDYKMIFKHSRYQPFNPNWLVVARTDLADVYDMVARDPKFDYKSALAAAEHRANTYIMQGRPESEMRKYRKIALVVILIVGALVVLGAILIFRSMREKAAASIEKHGGVASVRNVYRRWLPWMLLVPALFSVGIWAYFPLVRGTLMAFMDYKLMGERSWIGLDNFINVFLDQAFRDSLLATLKYVTISLTLTFVSPIVLAIMLNEIPWFKQSYRTIFFLPQVMSGIIIMLLWKEMFDGSAYGMLNQALMYVANDVLGFQVKPIDWLGSTFWAPICVVIPMLWAHVGMASLIYLAALKSVPEDIYEAADIDGAGLLQKIRHITLPTLYPLIVILFVGAFIGCFHQMQNIFVMTGGLSGTRVLSLHIWLTAYADLKFGPATATAWMLGSALIGFTVWQLRILKRVEFRRAAEN